MTIQELTVNELFSGIGAQRKALELLGIPHKVIGISEIDKYAIKSYEAIFGATRNYGDISAIDKLDYADFWTYSFPCVDISISGKLAGITRNTRSGLLYQVERLLNCALEHDELPKYLMLENVKNLVGKTFKEQFDEWLDYLNELGYNNYWQVLNSKDYGIPQNRERVFVISIRKDVDSKKFGFPEAFDNGVRLKHLLEDTVDCKFYLRQELQDNFRKKFFGELGITETTGCHVSNKGNNIEGLTDICGTLMARDYKGFVNQRMTGIVELREVGTLKGCGLPFDKMHDQSGRVYSPEGLCPTLNTCGGGHREPKIIEQPSDDDPQVLRAERTAYGKEVRKAYESGLLKESRHNMRELRPRNDGVSNTLTTVQKDNLLLEPHHCRIRKLTPRECWRLMGFTDEDFDKAQEVNSNSQLYKQAGNSIVVSVLYYIFKNLFEEYQSPNVDINVNNYAPPNSHKLVLCGYLGNFKQGYTVYDSCGIACTLKANGGGLDRGTGLYIVD